MIPTLIVIGLLLGRWWKPTLAFSAVAWPALLFVSGVYANGVGLPNPLAFAGSAALLAVANTGVGVVINRGGAAAMRAWQRRQERPAETTT